MREYNHGLELYIIWDEFDKEHIMNPEEFKKYCRKKNINKEQLKQERRFGNIRLVAIVNKIVTRHEIEQTNPYFEIEQYFYRIKDNRVLKGGTYKLHTVFDDELKLFCDKHEIDFYELTHLKTSGSFRVLYRYNGKKLIVLKNPNEDIVFIKNNLKKFCKTNKINWIALTEEFKYNGWELLSIERFTDVTERIFHKRSKHYYDYLDYIKKFKIKQRIFTTKYGRFYEPMKVELDHE